MQVVAATGNSFSSQEADFSTEAGFASMVQAAKGGAQTQSETSKSSFLNIFTQGIEQAGKLFADLKIDEASTTISKDTESELSFGDTSAMGGVFAQLFVLQGSGGALAAQAGEELTELTALSNAVPQTSDDPSAVLEVYQAKADLPYGENVKAEPAMTQDDKMQLPKQKTAADEQSCIAVSKSNVTEKIVKAMKSMGGQENTGQSFGEFISDEKKPAKIERVHDDLIIGNHLPLGMAVDNEQEMLKTSAIEKALDRFLNDFKDVEASSSEIQIVLEPESFGTLTISVSRTKNGIAAKIQAEDKSLCAIVSDQIQKLVESMEHKGITVEQVDVVFGQTGQNLSFTQNSFGSRQQNTSGDKDNAKEKVEASSNSGFFDLWQAPSGGEEGNGTIEYRI